MNRLINAFRAVPSPSNRKKIEAHIQKHPFSICTITVEDQQFLKANGFTF
jgi:hypothetical protein